MNGSVIVEKCRACGQPLHGELCLNTIMLKCCNPRCWLRGYDLDAASYEKIDLGKYKEKRHA